MATYGPLFTKTYPASGDLSSYQYHFMTLDTDGQVSLAGATDPICGILQNNPDAENEPASVGFSGFSKLRVDGNSVNIANEDKLAANASGHGAKTTTDLDDFGAIAREASTADGDIIRVEIKTGGLVSAS